MTKTYCDSCGEELVSGEWGDPHYRDSFPVRSGLDVQVSMEVTLKGRMKSADLCTDCAASAMALGLAALTTKAAAGAETKEIAK